MAELEVGDLWREKEGFGLLGPLDGDPYDVSELLRRQSPRAALGEETRHVGNPDGQNAGAVKRSKASRVPSATISPRSMMHTWSALSVSSM